MSELGRLLEAIHNSRSWQTLRAEYRVWTHRARQAAAWDADVEESGATSYATLVSEDELPDEAQGLWRVWIAKPDRLRQETEGEALSETTTVVVGSTWWMWNEHSGARTNEGHEEASGGGVQYGAWLEPAKVLGSLSFEAPEETTQGERPAFRTKARRPSASGFDEDQMTWDLHTLGGVAEEYLLDVDQERGILLRAECRFKDEPFLIGELTDVAFDEDFEPNVFVLEPPDGEEIQPFESLVDRRHFHETITEAAAAAPFPVFILPSVPDEWSIRVWTTPPEERPPRPYAVSVHYEAEDGTSGLSITNFPAGESDIEVFLGGGPPFEDVERDGIKMRARSRSDDWPDTTVYLTRGQTDLRLMSSQLGGEQVIDAAARLVVAPSSLPDL